MSTKNEVLKALLDEEKPVSGERLARRLGITRNSVWKAIQQLREAGYAIEACTNRGYRLLSSPDRLSAPEILKCTYTDVIGRQIEVHKRLDSTNARAKLLAGQGAPHGYLICAEPRSRRIWQEDECAIIYFLAKLLAARIKIDGETLDG